jgi:hypothetical protein
MSTDNETVTPPSDAAFAAVLNLLALVTDPKATGARLRDLQKKTAAAMKAEGDLVAARAAHDQFVAAEQQALDKRKREIDELYNEVQGRRLGLDRRDKEFHQQRDEVETRERHLKFRLLRLANVDWNETLQGLPTWPQIDQICYGVPIETPMLRIIARDAAPPPGESREQGEGEQDSQGVIVNGRPDLSLRRAVR